MTNQVLLAAADLLETTGWTQAYYARDSAGNPVASEDKNAACFCTYGALRRVTKSRKENHVTRLILEETLRRITGDDYILNWNDKPGQTAENVIATLRKAAYESV
jgi:hypothetical protein